MLIASSTSPAVARAATWRANSMAKPQSLAIEVRAEESVVSAMAGKPARSTSKRPTSSAAICWASAALPPLPHSRILLPRRRASTTLWAAAAMSAARVWASACLVSALARRRSTTSLVPADCSAGPQASAAGTVRACSIRRVDEYSGTLLVMDTTRPPAASTTSRPTIRSTDQSPPLASTSGTSRAMTRAGVGSSKISTWSTHARADSTAARSAAFETGRPAPFRARTERSLLRPTRRSCP